MSPLPPQDNLPPAAAAAAAASGSSKTSAAAAAAGLGLPQAAAITPVSSSSSSWLRGLAAACRRLQLRLLCSPPKLQYPDPCCCPNPDLSQPQEASLVIFVVVPDDEPCAVLQEGIWGSGFSTGARSAAAGDGSSAAVQQGLGPGSLGFNAAAADVLLLRSYETAAAYLAPLTQPTAVEAALQQPSVTLVTCQEDVTNNDGSNSKPSAAAAANGLYVDVTGPSRIPPALVMAEQQQQQQHQGTTAAAATTGSQQQQQQGLVGQRQQGLDVVVQLVRRSAVLAPSEAQLRGLAMTTYNKVRLQGFARTR
jgi:hypothetical protein